MGETGLGSESCIRGRLFAFILLFWHSLVPLCFSKDAGVAKVKRSSSLYTEISFGRDDYRAQDISAQIGIDHVFAFPIGISRNVNAFTDASVSFFAGGDWDLGPNLTPRLVINYYSEPNDVTGLGLSASNRFHLEGFWRGKQDSILAVGIEGSRYSTGNPQSPVVEDSGALLGSKKGRGKGDSLSTVLNTTGVLQLGLWTQWTHSLSDFFSLTSTLQKYFYLGASTEDGNAAISDRPFVPGNVTLLVDGFPEWSADFGFSMWREPFSGGAKIAFSRARNTSSSVIVAPAVDLGWDVTPVLSLGTMLSYAFGSESALLSLSANWQL